MGIDVALFTRRIGVLVSLVLVVSAPVAVPAVGAVRGHPLATTGGGNGSAARLVRSPETGLVSFVGTRPGRPLAWPAGVGRRTPPTVAARAFVASHADQFGVAGRSAGLGPGRAQPDPAGGYVVRFTQQLGGYPVLGGTISVALTRAKRVAFVAAHTSQPTKGSPTARVSPRQARAAALASTSRQARTSMADLRVAGAPRLTIFEPTLLGLPTSARPGLVYRLEVVSRDGAAPVRELVLVDAVRGGVVWHADELTQAERQTVCTAADQPSVQDPSCPPTGRPGQPTPVANPSASSDTDVKDAYTYADATYRFYRDVVGSTSAIGLPTGSGDRALNSTVHLCDPTSTSTCTPLVNAFWDGREMVYGDGFSSADDVVGHELTHSVTEHTSNLFYWYQSGAIDESMSDVMGELVDQWDGLGTDTEANRWVLGEDLPASVGPVRDMADPTTAPPGAVGFIAQPDRMTSTLYYAKQAQDSRTGQAYPDDNGGVHVNSGVGNKAAYLVVDGGTFNGVTVPGLGGADPGTRTAAITKAAKIYYLADQTIPSAGDYADLYNVLPAACDRLVGTAGIATADCASVRDAVRATEMNRQPPVGAAPEAPTCGGGRMHTLWFDNLENPGSGRWKRSSAHTAWGPFYYPQDHNAYGNLPLVYATSGVEEIWGDDPDPRAGASGTGHALPRDGTIAMTRSVRVPTGKRVFLRFNHAFAFEWYPAAGGHSALYTDGGRVEYSADGGKWRSAAGLFDFAGYNHTLYGLNAAGNKVIYKFRGFGGDSHGYISSRLDLKPLAGKSVRFRFHDTADASVGAGGWFIDDVRFYTCSG
ncbi:MAG TPA: M4 family metallopeptidase [Marmoricola sp.]|nr:M4 family metallopeptidase [Marmoricola sp.]